MLRMMRSSVASQHSGVTEQSLKVSYNSMSCLCVWQWLELLCCSVCPQPAQLSAHCTENIWNPGGGVVGEG